MTIYLIGNGEDYREDFRAEFVDCGDLPENKLREACKAAGIHVGARVAEVFCDPDEGRPAEFATIAELAGLYQSMPRARALEAILESSDLMHHADVMMRLATRWGRWLPWAHAHIQREFAGLYYETVVTSVNAKGLTTSRTHKPYGEERAAEVLGAAYICTSFAEKTREMIRRQAAHVVKQYADEGALHAGLIYAMPGKVKVGHRGDLRRRGPLALIVGVAPTPEGWPAQYRAPHVVAYNFDGDIDSNWSCDMPDGECHIMTHIEAEDTP